MCIYIYIYVQALLHADGTRRDLPAADGLSRLAPGGV